MHENWPNVSDDTSKYHLDKRNLIPELTTSSVKYCNGSINSVLTDGKAQFCDDFDIIYRKKKFVQHGITGGKSKQHHKICRRTQ